MWTTREERIIRSFSPSRPFLWNFAKIPTKAAEKKRPDFSSRLIISRTVVSASFRLRQIIFGNMFTLDEKIERSKSRIFSAIENSFVELWKRSSRRRNNQTSRHRLCRRTKLRARCEQRKKNGLSDRLSDLETILPRSKNCFHERWTSKNPSRSVQRVILPQRMKRSLVLISTQNQSNEIITWLNRFHRRKLSEICATAVTWNNSTTDDERSFLPVSVRTNLQPRPSLCLENDFSLFKKYFSPKMNKQDFCHTRCYYEFFTMSNERSFALVSTNKQSNQVQTRGEELKDRFVSST